MSRAVPKPIHFLRLEVQEFNNAFNGQKCMETKFEGVSKPLAEVFCATGARFNIVTFSQYSV
jgi:hypothetical protein